MSNVEMCNLFMTELGSLRMKFHHSGSPQNSCCELSYGYSSCAQIICFEELVSRGIVIFIHILPQDRMVILKFVLMNEILNLVIQISSVLCTMLWLNLSHLTGFGIY